MPSPDLRAAASAVTTAEEVVSGAAQHLAGRPIDDNQVIAYDVAHSAAAIATARVMLDYGGRGDLEARLTTALVADAISELMTKVVGREEEWDAKSDVFDPLLPFLREHRAPAFIASLATEDGPRHLDADFELVQDSFRRFAEERVRPVAEHVHRTNADIPEDLIGGLAEMGGFGLSVPEAYGGWATGGESDYLGMVIATEELSRASLGAGGSLITRPEILTRALVQGGTEEQKQHWLPKIATGEVMVAVAVTEPDFGSDVANLTTTATRVGDGHADAGWRITGVKTWCTFAARADVLMLLARTDPDRTTSHRGLSLFIVPKPRGAGHGFEFTQDEGGRLEGRAIDTIGYRGMHSYEVVFDDWWISDDCLVGGDAGLGKGFYLQMEGFENGRLQTAARAVGVMQAALDAARAYAEGRVVFGRPVGDYQLTQVKLARMAYLTQAGRQAMYHVARLMATGSGALEASMVKAYVCKAAEWVTREALQIHGGMGYAEEFPVSRLFVDARVLSIFEGADETLALRVIARRLVDRHET